MFLGGAGLSKISFNSAAYKRVEKNLTLENISIDKKIALQAIEAVNNGKKLTPTMIKEVIKVGKI